ncbi:hypothetical protein CWATWH0005_4896 [Crocosphaera watsonii WH 0005]|uniref:Uncharacterized protein n=1 Tax=Crocosphaera watsonii WH 0005 TaxID=423472 RepID=T2IZU3_CROWT|nr:hypothetical protein CWATWH0005_4896 [Crocosphaera watsonii WH 0005]
MLALNFDQAQLYKNAIINRRISQQNQKTSSNFRLWLVN